MRVHTSKQRNIVLHAKGRDKIKRRKKGRGKKQAFIFLPSSLFLSLLSPFLQFSFPSLSSVHPPIHTFAPRVFPLHNTIGDNNNNSNKKTQLLSFTRNNKNRRSRKQNQTHVNSNHFNTHAHTTLPPWDAKRFKSRPSWMNVTARYEDLLSFNTALPGTNSTSSNTINQEPTTLSFIFLVIVSVHLLLIHTDAHRVGCPN